MNYLFVVIRETGSPAVDVTVCKDKVEALGMLDFIRPRPAPGGTKFIHRDYYAVIYPDGTRFEVQPYSREAFDEAVRHTNATQRQRDKMDRIATMYTTGVDAWKTLGDVNDQADAMQYALGVDFGEIEHRVTAFTNTSRDSAFDVPYPPYDKVTQNNKLPIPMILHCPTCGVQHVDREERSVRGGELIVEDWNKIPHRSHKCRACNCVWRPCDFETVGVRNIDTRGKSDTLDNTQGGPYRLPASFPIATGSVLTMLENQLSAAESLSRLDAGDMKTMNIAGIQRVVKLAERISAIRLAINSIDFEVLK